MSVNAPALNTPYSVTLEGDSYVVRADRQLSDREDLNLLLDYFLFRSIVQRSQATQPEIDALASAVERAAWERTKSNFASKVSSRSPGERQP